MLIQSLLFFILGVASISWLLVIFAPLIWRKAVHFAHKHVSAQIPLSHTEIQANYDFLSAQHAVKLAQNEHKYDSLQKKYAQQKIQLSKVMGQLYQLSLRTEDTYSSKKEVSTIKQNDGVTNNCMMEIKIMHEKIAQYQQRLQKIKIHELATAANHQLLDELREETKELAAILSAQIALQEGEISPINTLIKNSKRKNDLASRIRKKIAHAKKSSLHK
ncbi:hypothetical protein [Bartonella sp. CB169]|uniref:hypothetical protein n=1 Tax=Bartonella sp. CB169 TaxID=3112257 RepID=UPI00300DF6D6